MVKFLAQSKKAITGAVGVTAAAYPGLAKDGLTTVEYFMLAGAFIGGFALVWLTPRNAE